MHRRVPLIPPRSGVRHRDIYPLPLVPGPGFASLDLQLSEADWDVLVRFTDFCVIGLNQLYGCVTPNRGHSTAMQRDVHGRLGHKVLRMLDRLQNVGIFPSGTHALAKLLGEPIDGIPKPSGRLIASKCDILDHSALVDPLPSLPPCLSS